MKKYALTMSVAVLSAALVWGCQEQGSTPFEPDGILAKAGGKGSGGGGGKETAMVNVDLREGMVATGQSVVVEKDNKREFVLRGDGRIDYKLNLKVTACKLTNGIDDLTLLDRLHNGSLLDRGFHMTFDKTVGNGDPSTKHQITSTWTLEGEGDFSLKVGTLDDFPSGSVTVAKSGNTYIFTGGGVMIWDRSGKVKDHVKIKCLHTGTIIVTVN